MSVELRVDSNLDPRLAGAPQRTHDALPPLTFHWRQPRFVQGANVGGEDRRAGSASAVLAGGHALEEGCGTDEDLPSP